MNAQRLMLRLLLPTVLLLPLVLAGCAADNPEDRLADYLARLARPLDRSVPTPDASPIPRLPSVGKLQQPLEGGSLGTLDFLSLAGCEVQVTIGKRNSSLGLMAAPSQRLLMELEYLRLAPACIRYLRREDRGKLADTLQAAHDLKRQQLPTLVFNATLGSREFRQLWQAPTLLGDYPARTGSAVTTALEAINRSASRWLTGEWDADGTAFELQLSEISRGDGGALLRALALQADWLAAANRVLENEEGPLCRGPIRPRAADVLPNVVSRYFAKGIQAWSADLARREQALLPPLRALEAQLEAVLPENYREWREARDQDLARGLRAPREHVEAVQALLEPCGGLPAA